METTMIAKTSNTDLATTEEQLFQWSRDHRELILTHRSPDSAAIDEVELLEPARAIIARAKRGVEIAANVRCIPIEKEGNAVLLQFMFGFHLDSDEWPHQSSIEVSFKTRDVYAANVFPDRQDETLIDAGFEGAVGLKTEGGFHASQYGIGDAYWTSDVRLRVGPIKFSLTRSLVEVTGRQSATVNWAIRSKSKPMGLSDFGVLIETQHGGHSPIEVEVSIWTMPVKSKWLLFKEHLPKLSDKSTLSVNIR